MYCRYTWEEYLEKRGEEQLPGNVKKAEGCN